jgi:hypothetical protein
MTVQRIREAYSPPRYRLSAGKSDQITESNPHPGIARRRREDAKVRLPRHTKRGSQIPR